MESVIDSTICRVDAEEYELDAADLMLLGRGGIPYSILGNKDAVERAKELVLETDFPAVNELQLDLDGEEAIQEYEKRRHLFGKVMGVFAELKTPSKSGNVHVRLFTQYRLSTAERIAYQAILGSDWKRELFSMRRYVDKDEHPTLLFEKNTIPVEQKVALDYLIACEKNKRQINLED